MNLPLWLHRFLQDLRAAVRRYPPAPYHGIDVSEHNGNVDFANLPEEIDFAILRCGYGSDYSDQDDARFAENAAKCLKAGLPYGVYLYSYAKNTDMARSEAEHTLRLLRGREPQFGIWYDIEDDSLPYNDTLPVICQTYCDAILAAGYPCVGLYASLSVMEHYLSVPLLKPYEKWVAQWNTTCDYPNPGMWQYTDSGILNHHQFDMNCAYKDYKEMSEETMTQDTFNKMMSIYQGQLEDKAPSGWAQEVWEKAKELGVFDGSAPRSPLTREQAAMVLERLDLL